MGELTWSDVIQRMREAKARIERMPKIEGKILEESDIGRNVTYRPNHAMNDPKQWEHGKLSSF